MNYFEIHIAGCSSKSHKQLNDLLSDVCMNLDEFEKQNDVELGVISYTPTDSEGEVFKGDDAKCVNWIDAD